MKTTGQYQNENAELVDKFGLLDLSSYERLFKLYTTSNNDKEFYFYNILKKISIPENINEEYVSYYAVKANSPMTIVSWNIYEDIKLWWLIYILNEDILKDNLFVVPGGTQLKYILPDFLDVVFEQITNMTVYNGRHY
jgi:hypothetical protein